MTHAKAQLDALVQPATGPRQYLKYTFLRLRPEWRRLPAAERTKGRREVEAVLEDARKAMTLRTYSLLGIRGDCDVLLWSISEGLDEVQRLVTALSATPLGGYMEIPYSYLAMTQPSQYTGKGTAHAHEGQEGNRHEPKGRSFLFVYPFTKKRAWYGLPFEERMRIMGPHFRIGHKYPGIHIHTGYSFGLDDQEFVLAFEGDHPADFLDLVQELRATEASQYTELETPIFTCRAVPPRALVAQWL